MRRCTTDDVKILQGIIAHMTPDMLRALLSHLLIIFIGRTRISFETFSKAIDITRLGSYCRDQKVRGEPTPIFDEEKPS
ncbi:MAG: hypothetical protein ABSH06_32105 [Thermodesulfobacteriota bacterium]|jgi:hypothetical protein